MANKKNLKKETNQNKKRGCPTKYQPWMDNVAKALATKGFIERDIFSILGISEPIGIKYKKLYPSFSKSLKEGAENKIKTAEKRLYDLAKGYKFRSEKIVVVSDGNNAGSHVERVPITLRSEPNLRAIEYILNNRKPRKKFPEDGWGDIKEIDIGNADGEPFVIEIK
ncbi:MAG: hypothetical protein PHF86_14120 [Candidatus Nanoarchaeia archaeon]|nr:hypothetical protein [Candidatus Nanoarchaeia archaeon]